MANGWKISAIAFLQSGAPFTITTGADKNADGYSNDRPDLVPGVNPFLSPHRPRNVSTQAWFNTAAFIANGPGVPGGIGPGGADGNTPRDFLRAPDTETSIWEWDVTSTSGKQWALPSELI